MNIPLTPIRFCTGDMARINPDGYVLIVDSKKISLSAVGENIASLELETTILAHPAILECAVIPLSNDR